MEPKVETVQSRIVYLSEVNYMDIPYYLHFATTEDIDAWMDLVDLVKGNFPGFDREEYVKTLERNVNRKSALCVKYHDTITGVLLFSINVKCLSCMAVHPKHRRKGIGSVLVEKMISLFPANIDIDVDTFRADDRLGDAPRALYKKLNFVEGEEFIGIGDYPVQKFTLRRNQA